MSVGFLKVAYPSQDRRLIVFSSRWLSPSCGSHDSLGAIEESIHDEEENEEKGENLIL